MSSENWVEVELTATDQAGKSVTRHVEYRAVNPAPEQAVAEIVGHVLRQVGPDRVHAAGPDRTQDIGKG